MNQCPIAKFKLLGKICRGKVGEQKKAGEIFVIQFKGRDYKLFLTAHRLMIFRSTAMWKFIISPAFFCSPKW
jgi:hypothetical protein